MLSRKQVRSGHHAAIYDLYAAGAGFYSAAADGYLVHWHRDDVDFGRVVASVEGGKFLSLVATDDGLVAGALDGGVHWLFPDRPDANRHVARHTHGVFSILRVGDSVYTAGGDGILCRWSVGSGRSQESLPLSRQSLRRLAHDPVVDRLAVGASDGRVYLLDRGSMAVLDSQDAHPPSCFAAAFSPDGAWLFTGGRDATICRWSVGEGKLEHPRRVTAHLLTVNALAVHPGGEFLASASRDKTIKIWRTDTLDLLKVAETVRDRGHVNSVNTLLWLDDRTLLTAGDDRRILEWDFTP